MLNMLTSLSFLIRHWVNILSVHSLYQLAQVRIVGSKFVQVYFTVSCINLFSNDFNCLFSRQLSPKHYFGELGKSFSLKIGPCRFNGAVEAARVAGYILDYAEALQEFEPVFAFMSAMVVKY